MVLLYTTVLWVTLSHFLKSTTTEQFRRSVVFETCVIRVITWPDLRKDSTKCKTRFRSLVDIKSKYREKLGGPWLLGGGPFGAQPVWPMQITSSDNRSEEEKLKIWSKNSDKFLRKNQESIALWHFLIPLENPSHIWETINVKNIVHRLSTEEKNTLAHKVGWNVNAYIFRPCKAVNAWFAGKKLRSVKLGQLTHASRLAGWSCSIHSFLHYHHHRRYCYHYHHCRHCRHCYHHYTHFKAEIIHS